MSDFGDTTGMQNPIFKIMGSQATGQASQGMGQNQNPMALNPNSMAQNNMGMGNQMNPGMGGMGGMGNQMNQGMNQNSNPPQNQQNNGGIDLLNF